MLKDVEKNRAAKKERPYHAPPAGTGRFSKASPHLLDSLRYPGLRRRRPWRSLPIKSPLVIALAVFVVGLGLPRWVLGVPHRSPQEEIHRTFRPRHRRDRTQCAQRPSHQRSAADRGAGIA